MNSLFWSRMHGGATHFPIALVFAGALFDMLSLLPNRIAGKYEFGVLGYWLIILGALGSFGAVLSGLALSKWTVGGKGLVLWHHLFVWPAFTLIVGLGTWRFLVGAKPPQYAFVVYLVTLLVSCGLIGVAGFFGGEMLLGQ
jgi:uncharacterized membrane protein